MPKAFSLTYGLELETEAASFWAWLNDVRDALDGTGSPGQPIKEFVDSQRAEIDRYLEAAADVEAAKRTIVLGLAVVGFQYASQQKLLNGLEDLGLLDMSGQPRRPAFDTISQPGFEGPEPPR